VEYFSYICDNNINTMYKIKFIDQKGKKSLIYIKESQAWLNFGNFSGMGKFTKLKISQVPDKEDLVE